ncbi:unnamed protein product [Dracunculus medinensis]|uniref:TRAF-type domain-containing protein n=1 Tax=Dracunculus medinensis TaxID=318479 RepID=A0A0N4U7R0_DRAME|nr:unnamed protein product [Dracunculus medinensis]
MYSGTFLQNSPYVAHFCHPKYHVFDCKYADVVCQRGCGQIYIKMNEQKHLNEDCDRRMGKCEFCEKEIALKGMDIHLKVIDHHSGPNPVCPDYIIDCPNNCGLKAVPREKIKQHLPVCVNAGAACPFNEFGCDYMGDTRNTSMLLFNMETIMEMLVCKMDALQRRTATLEKLYGPQTIWRIDNVKQKQNEARSGAKTMIFSPPFITGRHGYKMFLSASLYGDGPIRGQYMSVFVGIMRGEYDALLEWPFTHKVTITLMDQNPDVTNRNDISYIIKPNPLPAYKAYLDRPVSERNASFGAVKFCELEILDRYIRDDVIYIKVNVDTDSEKYEQSSEAFISQMNKKSQTKTLTSNNTVETKNKIKEIQQLLKPANQVPIEINQKPDNNWSDVITDQPKSVNYTHLYNQSSVYNPQ